MELTPRLEAVASFVDAGSTVADIGTDHALLPIALIQRGRCRHAILTDIRRGPLETARENVRAAGLLPMAEFYLTDGIKEILPLHPDCYIIAGMGGETIAGILSVELTRYLSGVKLILQPMTKQRELREFLTTNGFHINTEVLAREKERIYTIMCCCFDGKGEEYTELELTCGRPELEMSDSTAADYLEGVKRQLERQYFGRRLAHTDTDADRQLLEALGKHIEQLKAALKNENN